MRKVIDALVFVLLVAVVVLAVLLWNDHKSTARIENYITKPDGLAAWMDSQPAATRNRLDDQGLKLTALCGWAAKSAPAEMKCPVIPARPGQTTDPPTNGPKWP